MNRDVVSAIASIGRRDAHRLINGSRELGNGDNFCRDPTDRSNRGNSDPETESGVVPAEILSSARIDDELSLLFDEGPSVPVVSS